MIKELHRIIKKVENNEIKDPIILYYFYFVFQVENELSPYLMFKLKNYDEKKKI